MPLLLTLTHTLLTLAPPLLTLVPPQLTHMLFLLLPCALCIAAADLCTTTAAPCGILIGTQFNNIHLSGAYYYLDFLRLLNQPKVVARTDVPNIGGDAYVQSWVYTPESDLMAIIFQSVSPFSH
jgi:hypothetical protein